MVVADASAIIDALIRRGARGEWAAAALTDASGLVAPHLVDAEFVSGLRHLAVRQLIPERGAQRALREFADLRITRFPTTRLLRRMWQLRHTLTSYDATYIA